MSPLKPYLAAVAAACCVLSAVAQPAEPRPSMPREIEAVFEHDPNEWFNNVEIIAGRKIGRETVDYVRNILKYWVAYRLALDPNEGVQPPAAPDKQT